MLTTLERDPAITTSTTETRPAGDGTASTDAVVVDGLTKRYGRRTAVENLSFTVPRGAVAGLIGPNGAGKTTVMAMLLGLVRPTSGEASVLGHSIRHPRQYLRHVGALIESPAFHPAVSGVQNLRSLAVLGGHDTAGLDGLIELVGLAGRGTDRYGSYSLGMKQRLGIAAALIGDPQLVVLDEPTNGLDPAGMKDVRRLIRRFADEGRTVVVSTHLLSELEHVCDFLVVIDRGGLVHLGTPDSLTTGADRLVLRAADRGRVDDLLAVAAAAGLPTQRDGDDIVIAVGPDLDVPALAGELNRRAHVAGVTLCELRHDRPDLETRYLELLAR